MGVFQHGIPLLCARKSNLALKYFPLRWREQENFKCFFFSFCFILVPGRTV